MTHLYNKLFSRLSDLYQNNENFHDSLLLCILRIFTLKMIVNTNTIYESKVIITLLQLNHVLVRRTLSFSLQTLDNCHFVTFADYDHNKGINI